MLGVPKVSAKTAGEALNGEKAMAAPATMAVVPVRAAGVASLAVEAVNQAAKGLLRTCTVVAIKVAKE